MHLKVSLLLLSLACFASSFPQLKNLPVLYQTSQPGHNVVVYRGADVALARQAGLIKGLPTIGLGSGYSNGGGDGGDGAGNGDGGGDGGDGEDGADAGGDDADDAYSAPTAPPPAPTTYAPPPPTTTYAPPPTTTPPPPPPTTAAAPSYSPFTYRLISQPAYKPAPVYHPAPVIYKPAPVVYKPAPVVYKPAPVVYKPAPVVYKPAPVVYKPAPVVHKPAPPAYKAAPSYVEPTYIDVDAKYDWEYAVKDDYTNNDFGHKESRNGALTNGKYYVALPDGRLQTVTYVVDGYEGYVPNVEYAGEAQYPPEAKPTYGASR